MRKQGGMPIMGLIIIDNCEQGSEEWFRERAGHPTASCFNKILTPKTMKSSSQAEKYMYQLAAERIAGPDMGGYESVSMQRGRELEDEARKLFELHYGIEVKKVGLIYPNDKKLYSCSPDGFWGEGLEIKCPIAHTHVSYLLAGAIPADYVLQVQGSMFVTEQDHWFFMSYYPGLPPLILRVDRDHKLCSTLKIELETFCEELDRITEKLRALQND